MFINSYSTQSQLTLTTPVPSECGSPIFNPVAVESLGPLADDAHRSITEIGRRMTFSTGDPRETAFLYQRISVAIQRYNAVCLTNTFVYDPS